MPLLQCRGPRIQIAPRRQRGVGPVSVFERPVVQTGRPSGVGCLSDVREIRANVSPIQQYVCVGGPGLCWENSFRLRHTHSLSSSHCWTASPPNCARPNKWMLCEQNDADSQSRVSTSIVHGATSRNQACRRITKKTVRWLIRRVKFFDQYNCGIIAGGLTHTLSHCGDEWAKSGSVVPARRHVVPFSAHARARA